MRQYKETFDIMRLIFYTLIIFLVLGCQSNSVISKKIYVKQIISNYVDFNIETIIDVNCEEFESQFSDMLETVIIKDSTQISRILILLKNVKIAGNEYYQHVDTRMKVQLKYNNDSIETICLSNFLIERNGKLFIRKDTLTRLLIKK